jgi:hypothetical protein
MRGLQHSAGVSGNRIGTAALGQSRRLRDVHRMSGLLPSTADLAGPVPTSEKCQYTTSTPHASSIIAQPIKPLDDPSRGGGAGEQRRVSCS